MWKNMKPQGTGHNHEQRHVAPFMYADKNDLSFVLQFRLVQPLDLPRLPKEFNHTDEPVKEYTGPDGEFLAQRPYFMPSMKSLVKHLEQPLIGFRFVYFDYKAEGGYHKYRFVFSKNDTRDEVFRASEKDLRQLLQNLMKRPSITANGGVRTYRNHAVDEETGELIPGKTWVSVGITDEVIPAKNRNNRNGKNVHAQKSRSAAWGKKFSPRSPKITKGKKKAGKALSQTVKPAETGGEDWHDKLAEIGKKLGLTKKKEGAEA